MKRLARLAAAAVVAAGSLAFTEPLSAEEPLSFNFSGDLDAQAVYAAANQASAFSAVSPLQGVTAAGFLDGKLVLSKHYTTLGLFDFTFQAANVLDHLNGAKLESLSLTVNELYADVNFGDAFFVRLGKQRLKWGAGYIFNPSDPVNPPKDPIALRAVREGVTALKAELIAKPVSLMSFAVLYDALDQTGFGSKLSTSVIPNTDLSVSGYWSESESWTAALNASVAPLYDIPGWDTLQLWIEGSIYDRGRYATPVSGPIPGTLLPCEPGGPNYALLAGGSAQLPVIGTMLLAEYYHLSEGLSAGALSAVYQALHSADPLVLAQSYGWYGELARRPGRQGQDYLFLSLSQPTVTDSGHPVFDKIGFLATCLLNLTDLSFFSTGGITTAFVKDSAINLTVSWANGEALSEFGNLPASLAATLDVIVYF